MLDLIYRTAPQQVMDCLEELGFLEGWSPEAERVSMIVAHYGYGAGAGTAFGALRRETRELASEAAAGAALGVLTWGVGWTTWLPLFGVEDAPWEGKTSEVLLPVIGHAVFGVFWGVTYRALGQKKG